MLLEMEGFDGIVMEAGRGSFIQGGNLQQGSRSYPLGFHNEGKTNVVKNYRIVERKSLKDMGESTEGEVAARWADWSVGGTSRSHMVASRGDFSHGGF